MTMNNISLIGRTTSEIELKTTNSGKHVVSFSLAVKRTYKTDVTDFINIVAWDKQADLLSEYVQKGELIGIVGELQSRKYETKDGEKRTAFEVIAQQIHFCGSKKDRLNSAETAFCDEPKNYPTETQNAGTGENNGTVASVSNQNPTEPEIVNMNFQDLNNSELPF